MSTFIIIFGIIIAAILLYIFLLNSIIAARQSVSEAWSDIDVQLKRRHDLIPNLVSTVKGYAQHEQSVFEEITQLRTQAMSSDPKDITKRSEIESQLAGTLSKLFAVSENYPELKANENFLDLQKQLTETEDEIASSRRIYNDNTALYNTKISTFPGNIIASLQKFAPAAFFQNQ